MEFHITGTTFPASAGVVSRSTTWRKGTTWDHWEISFDEPYDSEVDGPIEFSREDLMRLGAAAGAYKDKE